VKRQLRGLWQSLMYFMIAILTIVESTLGQTRGSSIAGLVLDGSGASLSGATVIIEGLNQTSRRELRSSESGMYLAGGLELGLYRIRVSAAGFQDVVVENVALSVEREVRLDHRLQLAGVSETATVRATSRTVDASLSGLTNLISGETIREQPLNGRDYLQLAALQPGVSFARSKNRSVNTGFGAQLSISGSRPVQNNFRLDGISVSDNTGSSTGSANGLNLGTDALREFSVLTNGFSVEYGRAAGGVVNAVTQGGQNELHGSLAYFHRNDNLDARNYFDPAKQPEFRRHQYAGTLGGALRRNRTFYFGGFEGLLQLRGNTATNTTLSDQARRGVVGGQTVRIDAEVARILSFFPSPNLSTAGDTGQFSFTNPTNSRENFYTSRFDHRFSDRHSLFARYTLNVGKRADLTAFALGRARFETRHQSAVVEHTSVLSPALVNSVRGGLSRTVSVSNLVEPVDRAIDNPDFVFVPGARAMGRIDVVGLSLFPGGSGGLDYDNNAFTSLQLYNDLSFVRGRHWIKAGISVERTRFNSDSQSLNSGEYRFPSVRDFLENRSDRFRALLPGSDTIRGLRQWIFGWYIQDRIQIFRNFSIQLGLRHEWITTPSEVQGKLANLDSLLSPAVRVGGAMFKNPSLRNLAPRAGFSWDLAGNGRTIVRGGYGIYHDQLLSQFLLIAGFRNPPAYQSGSIQALGVGRLPSAGYLELVNRPSLDLRAERLPQEPSQPYVQQWNFNVEQSLGRLGSLRAAYAGSHGLHLSQIIEDANLAPSSIASDGRLFFPAGGVRQNPNFGIIRDRQFEGQSFYQSLQIGWENRSSGVIKYSLSYVLSKSIDDDSATFAQTESENSIGIPVNGNSRFNRGLSNHDQRHNFVGTLTWGLGEPSSRKWRAVFGGWRISSIGTLTSGAPFTVTLAYDAARTLTLRPDRRGGQRPDLNPAFRGEIVTGDPLQWYNAAAFVRPEAGYLGNLGRNTLIGPGFFSVDAVLAKRMSMGRSERIKIDLRFECFNTLNHTNFDLPLAERMQVFTRTAIREDAGRITSASPGREVQLGVKVIF